MLYQTIHFRGPSTYDSFIQLGVELVQRLFLNTLLHSQRLAHVFQIVGASKLGQTYGYHPVEEEIGMPLQNAADVLE